MLNLASFGKGLAYSGSPDKQPVGDTWRGGEEILTLGNHLWRLWGLRSPAICRLQVGDPGKLFLFLNFIFLSAPRFIVDALHAALRAIPALLSTRHLAHPHPHPIRQKSRGLRIRGANGVNPSSQIRADDGPSSSSKGTKGVNPSFLFQSVAASAGWICRPQWEGPSTWLSPLAPMLISAENSLQAHPELLFNRDTPWPVKVTRRIKHHR